MTKVSDIHECYPWVIPDENLNNFAEIVEDDSQYQLQSISRPDTHLTSVNQILIEKMNKNMYGRDGFLMPLMEEKSETSQRVS